MGTGTTAAVTKDVTNKAGIRPAIWLDLSVNPSGFCHEIYTAAGQAFEAQDFGRALELYIALGTYKDSMDQQKISRYFYAKALTDAGDYTEAMEQYALLGDYLDSPSLLLDTRYQYALSLVKTKKYDQAIQLLIQIGQYKDSMTQLRKCFDLSGVPYRFIVSNAVNTGLDTGYASGTAIQGKDNHFGWELGRFFISGYTRVNDTVADQPVFIKTLGDSVTLWFSLEQDINALNGNSKLVINEDTNGYDQTMRVTATNFGKGALIIRHTDYQKAVGEPQIYTNYLLAKSDSGADTKVVLSEEGDYEVVLDYEIFDKGVNPLYKGAKKYSNYQISFKFSIRNGNCMVYPFDIATGAELQNTSVTASGFYLDLARSRYLDINVKRTVLVRNESGVQEDVRFNRPANDGDRYTAEGIYTISVHNRATGEQTTKVIFVGTDELLQQYIANGFSLKN